jgi:aminoglycoside/choline kinase family phosphotransferase
MALTPISPDGSDRIFERVIWHGARAVKIMPSPGEGGRAEALSFYNIGRYLFRNGLHAPEIFFFDENDFSMVVEDLGDRLFFSHVSELCVSAREADLLHGYRMAIDMLTDLQARASRDFDTAWCCDTVEYNAALAFEREAMYFLREFVSGIMGLEYHDRLVAELAEFADKVDAFPLELFLHRDFQSRNIMIKEGGLRIIDFQAARLGPAGYDAASLIFDPYIPMPDGVRDILLDYYCARAVEAGVSRGRNPDEMRREVKVTGVLRLMQAIGAYAFLSTRKKRAFFSGYIDPALAVLGSLLYVMDEHDSLPVLESLVREICEKRFSGVSDVLSPQ